MGGRGQDGSREARKDKAPGQRVKEKKGRRRVEDIGLIREEREWEKRANAERQRERGMMLFCQCFPVGTRLLVKKS